ncbi:MAG: PAS domain S-box protein [Bacteroidota bacterium]
MNLLLIEDNPGDARLIQIYLTESRLANQPKLETVVRLSEAESILDQQTFDLILLDLSLPDSYGLDTFDKALDLASDTPIIVLTGLEDEAVGVEAVRKGAQDFLIKKELNESVLSRAIQYALERHRLSEQLEQSEARLKEAQKLAQFGNFEIDLNTQEVTWSDVMFDIMELERAEGEPTFDKFLDRTPEEGRAKIEKIITETIQSREKNYIEHQVTTFKGRERYLYSIINPIISNGEVVRLFGTAHDITQRKLTEEKLKASERRYRALFHGMTDEVLVFHLDSENHPQPFLEVNEMACELLGYTREELLDMTVEDIVDGDTIDLEKRIEHLVENKEFLRDSVHFTKDGTKIPVEVRAHLFEINGKPTVLSIGRDIRERLKLEQEILDISEQERRRIGQDLHDGLGQMLTGIGLISKNLAREMKRRDLEEAEHVQEIADLVKEADQYARGLSHGLVPVNVEANGLDSALQNLTEKTTSIFGVQCHFQPKELTLLEDTSTAVHLYRIAQEAINNAIKHGKSNEIWVELQSDDEMIELEVRDDGVGFNPGQDENEGMGLRIMNYRAQMIGGKLRIDSSGDYGTRVTCSISKRIS